MFCLDNTDTLEGGASVDAKVDYTVHGLVGTTFTVLADGQLSDTDPSVLYTAGAAISVVSITLCNTHTSAVACNLYLDSANGGNPRRLIPKDVSLGVGFSLHFDGQRCTMLDTSGNVQTLPGLHAARHKVSAADDLLGAPGAIGGATPATGAFTTINLTGGQIAFPSSQSASADVNTLDDYEEGTWTVAMTCATSGTIALYANADLGSYTKIGDIVHAMGTIRIETISSPVGDLRISLPFTIGDLAEFAGWAAGSVAMHGVDLTGDYSVAQGVEGAAYFQVVEMHDNAAWTTLQCSQVANGDYFSFVFSYKVA